MQKLLTLDYDPVIASEMSFLCTQTKNFLKKEPKLEEHREEKMCCSQDEGGKKGVSSGRE